MFRYTFHFTSYTQGWSETLYRATPFGSTEGNLLENYILNRLQLLSTECRLIGLRASNLDSARDVIIYPIPLQGRGGTWVTLPAPAATPPDPGGAPTAPEDSFTALLLRLSDGAQHYRNFPMLGIPDQVFQQSGIEPGFDAILRGRLNGWIASMPYASFGMKLQGAPTVQGRISEFFPKTDTNRMVCLGLTGGVPTAGALITLGGVKPFNRLNRTWRVASVTPGDDNNDCFIYLAKTTSLDAFGAVQGGKYKVCTYGMAILNQYTISRLTSRKTGIPFDTVRGRHSARSI